MEHITIGKEYNKGKIAYIKCVKNGKLNNIDIKNKCYLLIILLKGRLDFKVDNDVVSALGPSFICFNELENPEVISLQKAQYICVYFHPKFLNVNMTFEILRSRKYEDIATTHDMFMLKPFINKAYVVPISEIHIERIEQCAEYMRQELESQRDWYWSCRGRSYFMEIIIVLERMYGLMGYGFEFEKSDHTTVLNDSKLRDVVLYIESHYAENLTLYDISEKTNINHTTLTLLMKKEFGCTAMKFLMKHRVLVAKKQLAFTEIPIKDISIRTGFKTVQHFTRIFKSYTGKTPAEFRKLSVQKRKIEITKINSI